MKLITREDLYYNNYFWTAMSGDNPKIIGEPDSTLLNRQEGYEVLYFINKFAEINGFKKKESATKVERMMQEEVPNNIRSQKNIKEWIEQNWNRSKF